MQPETPAKTGRAFQPAHLLILTALAAVAIWMLIRQQHFNPAITETRGLDGAEAAVEAPGLLSKLPEGLQQMSAPESFDPDTLSEKINGKAELYLSAGFKSMRCRRYQLTDQPEAWFELFLYEMSTPRSAFSAYTLQQRPGSRPLDGLPFAYATENGLYAASGTRYLEIMGASDDPKLHGKIVEAARQLLQELPADSMSLPELELLPPSLFDPAQLKYNTKDVFSCSALEKVFTAPLKEGAGLGFVSVRKDAAEAREQADAYIAFLEQNMGAVSEVEGLPGAKIIDLFGLQEVVFTVGPVLAGIHEAEAKEAAAAAARMLHTHIQSHSFSGP